MGLPFAIVRPIAALFTAMFGGWLVNRYAREDEKISAAAAQSSEHDHCDCGCDDHDHEHHHHHEEDASCSCGSTSKSTFWEKLKGALEYGFVEMLQDVGNGS
jgi:ABC-type nickel/cobalt efflux system permease component RcnA